MVDYSEDAVRDWLNQIDENEFLERVRIKRDEMNFHRWEKFEKSPRKSTVPIVFKFTLLGVLYNMSRSVVLLS